MAGVWKGDWICWSSVWKVGGYFQLRWRMLTKTLLELCNTWLLVKNVVTKVTGRVKVCTMPSDSA